jgi:hypothetical protein
VLEERIDRRPERREDGHRLAEPFAFQRPADPGARRRQRPMQFDFLVFR